MEIILSASLGIKKEIKDVRSDADTFIDANVVLLFDRYSGEGGLFMKCNDSPWIIALINKCPTYTVTLGAQGIAFRRGGGTSTCTFYEFI